MRNVLLFVISINGTNLINKWNCSDCTSMGLDFLPRVIGSPVFLPWDHSSLIVLRKLVFFSFSFFFYCFQHTNLNSRLLTCCLIHQTYCHYDDNSLFFTSLFVVIMLWLICEWEALDRDSREGRAFSLTCFACLSSL